MAFGAAGALGGLLGPPLKEYEGETYEWSYSCCGSSCKGEGELVAVDSQTLAWRDVKGSFVPASAKLDASRDAANVHHFVTDDGSGVWATESDEGGSRARQSRPPAERRPLSFAPCSALHTRLVCSWQTRLS